MGPVIASWVVDGTICDIDTDLAADLHGEMKTAIIVMHNSLLHVGMFNVLHQYLFEDWVFCAYKHLPLLFELSLANKIANLTVLSPPLWVCIIILLTGPSLHFSDFYESMLTLHNYNDTIIVTRNNMHAYSVYSSDELKYLPWYPQRSSRKMTATNMCTSPSS